MGIKVSRLRYDGFNETTVFGSIEGSHISILYMAIFKVGAGGNEIDS